MAANHVEVDVKYCLACIFLGVKDEPCSGFLEAQFLCNLLAAVEELSYEGAVGFAHVHEACDVALGDNQKMDGRLGGNVVKSVDVVIFVDFFGRDFTLDDFTEKTIFTHGKKDSK